MKFDYVLRFAAIIAFSSLTACSGSSGGSSTTVSNCTLGAGPTLKISGAITFDRVPLLNTGNQVGALDFTNISIEPSKGVLVEAVCGSSVVTSASTDDTGQYTLSVPSGTNGVFVRAKAQMLKTGTPSWNVEVLDDSQATDLVFSMDSSPFNLDVDNVVKNLHAPSGFDGVSYTSTRVAAPFAIIDTVNKSMQLVLDVNPGAVFPPLDVNWSPVSNDGTFYTSNEISVLGLATSDTDEFDEHVIAHEWGHYFQDAFSRDNSIGGRHANGDILDIRVAFSEGFGNAFSAMVTGDPVYKDSQSIALSTGFSIDVESNNCTNEGWYSECSVQSVLYDFFDADNENSNDAFALGFAEIHEVMTADMPASDALSSIFSFINPFKAQPGISNTDTNTLLAAQSIDSITDDFGTGVSDGTYVGATSVAPVYTSVSDNFTTTVCSTAENGSFNGLGVFRFMTFTASASETATFTATKVNGPNGAGVTSADPDMYLYLKGEQQALGESFSVDTETFTATLIAGERYVLEVVEFSYEDPNATVTVNETCFEVTRT